MAKRLTKEEWLELNGFDVNGLTFCVFGDDTYSIKNWLKEQGCKFYCGSDAHHPEEFVRVKEVFERAIDLLDLKESDKFIIGQ